jgi:hypothetical protein
VPVPDAVVVVAPALTGEPSDPATRNDCAPAAGALSAVAGARAEVPITAIESPAPTPVPPEVDVIVVVVAVVTVVELAVPEPDADGSALAAVPGDCGELGATAGEESMPGGVDAEEEISALDGPAATESSAGLLI